MKLRINNPLAFIASLALTGYLMTFKVPETLNKEPPTYMIEENLRSPLLVD